MEYVTDYMKPEDWQQVRSIYLEGIGTGNSTFEADAPDWKKWDSVHIREHRLVVKEHDTVLAWAALSPVSTRCVYSGCGGTQSLRGGRAKRKRHRINPACGTHNLNRKGRAMDTAGGHLP